jgi:hypothetical protein
METINLKLIACTALVIAGTTLRAQNAVPAAGAEATGSGGSSSYTVGEPVYTTNTGTNGSVAQGVQQPYELFIVTDLTSRATVQLSINAYPNPTTDFLTLQIADLKNQTMAYELVDSKGKILLSKNEITTTETIAVATLTAATYYLKVTQNNKEVKIFKVIKN